MVCPDASRNLIWKREYRQPMKIKIGQYKLTINESTSLTCKRQQFVQEVGDRVRRHGLCVEAAAWRVIELRPDLWEAYKATTPDGASSLLSASQPRLRAVSPPRTYRELYGE
jgi:hypothetical protein